MWAQHFDHSEKYLIAIHPPNSIVVWDSTTGAKLWKKTYNEQLIAMDADPFDPNRLACNFYWDILQIFNSYNKYLILVVCPDCILLVEDFNLFSCPSSNGRKFYISSPKTASTPSTPSVSFPSSIAGSTDRSRDRLRKLMRDIIVGEAAPSFPGTGNNFNY